MFVRNNLPIAIVWDAQEPSSVALLSGLFKIWPVESNIPFLLFSKNGCDLPKDIELPSQYSLEQLSPDTLNLPTGRLLERGRVYSGVSEKRLEYLSNSDSKWSVKTTVEDVVDNDVSLTLAALTDYSKSFAEDGTVFSCLVESETSFFSLDQTPLLDVSRILSLQDPALYLCQQFGKARSYHDVVLGKANTFLEHLTGMRLDWFHRGWQFGCLSSELSGSVDLLSYCDEYSKSQGLFNKLLERNRSNYVTPQQLRSIRDYVADKIQNSNNQAKIWLIGSSELQLIQILHALKKYEGDDNQLLKQVRIYVTDTMTEQLAFLKQTGGSPPVVLNNFPDELEGYYKSLQIDDLAMLSAQTRSLRQRLVVHSKLNAFTDPPYRNTDVIVCGGLLSGLTNVSREKLINKFSLSQSSNALLVTSAIEMPEVFSTVSNCGYKSSPTDGLFYQEKVVNKPRYEDANMTVQAAGVNQTDMLALGRNAAFIIDDAGCVIDFEGSASAFFVDPFREKQFIDSKNLFEALVDSLATAANDLFGSRHPIKTVRKLIISELDVIMLSVGKEKNLARYDADQVWRFAIETIEDVELDLSIDKIGKLNSEAEETRALLANFIAEGQLKQQKSIRKLQDLNLELAEKNEQYSNEAAKYRLLNVEVSDSNARLNKQLRAANGKIEAQTAAFMLSDSPAAMLSEHGNFEIINDSMISKLHLNKNRLRLENLNIFRLDSELPNRTLIQEFGEVLKDGQSRSFETIIGGKSARIRLSLIESSAPGKYLLLEITDVEGNSVERTNIPSLFNGINIATIETDILGRIESMDSIVQSWLGKQDLSLVGRNLEEVIAPDYHSLHLSKWEELEANNFADYEIALLSGGNRLVWCRVKIVPHPSKPNSSYLLLLENIIEQQRTQQEILMSQKMESLGLLTGGIAHDFNNILAVIMGYTDLLLINAENEDNGEKSHLRHIRDAGERAQHLIKQMLFYSRGDDHHDARQHDVCKAVGELLPLVRSSFPKEIQLSTEIEVKNAFVDIDPTHLDQILMNMCINARDAIESTTGREGEITIAVDAGQLGEEIHQCASCRSSFSTVSPDDSNKFVVIRITDNGTGIDDAVIEHVFDPFFSTKEVGKGSGMGLSVIHGLVHQYKGHIELFSSNYGVQFCIWLPASEKNEVKLPQPQLNTGGPNLADWKVLLVEDDPVVAQVTELLLSNLGMYVVAASDGVAATEYLSNAHESIDLIVSDLSMPKMDGIGLANWCSERAISIPILLLTGNDGALEQDNLPPNVDSILSKPTSMRAIADRISSIQIRSQRYSETDVPDKEPELA